MRSEKGSITLFVLVSMIFFLAIAMSAYIAASNKLQGQSSDIEQIKVAYEQNISEIGLSSLYDQLTASESTNYNITSINYNLNGTYESGSYADTQYKIDWDKDFTIQTTVRVSSLDKRYLIIGGFDNESRQELSLEITEDNELMVYFGTGQFEKKEGTIHENEDIKIIFRWSASTDTYNITARGNNTNIAYSGIYEMSGSSENGLRIGGTDYRRVSQIFSTITISGLSISSNYSSGASYISKAYTDTEYKINWDNDFEIEESVRVSNLGKRYLVIGGYDGNSNQELNIEFTEENQLGINFGTEEFIKPEGTIHENEDIKVTFKWNASTDTYSVSAKGENTNIAASGTYEISGGSENGLRIGCVDCRTNDTVFNPITVIELNFKH